MPVAEALAMAFDIAEARPGQTEAVFALLPELLEATALPTRFLVAHAPGQPSHLLGAAAYVPVVHRAVSPGFRALCRVLPAHRRRGIARALVQRLAMDVAAWDVPHLLSWQAEPQGPASAFLQACGFRVNFSLMHFIGTYDSIHPMCDRLVRALVARGRVPATMRLLPLGEVPLDAVIRLHCAEFNASPVAARQLIVDALADPLCGRMSVALWDGHHLAGYLLAGPGADMPVLRFWASDPSHRSGWPAILLLDDYINRGHASGVSQCRFSCNDRNPAPVNIARKIGATLEEVRRGYVLDLELVA